MNAPEEKIQRLTVPDVDQILGQRFAALGDGFVRVVDYMGGDSAIVQAARVSYGEGTKRLHEDQGLIRYLLRHSHTTPFEMCEIKLHVRAPMDCWRQWIRHRTANVNEYSTRYSVAIDAAQTTGPGDWRSQAADNRQGSGAFISSEIGMKLSEEEAGLHQRSRDLYESRLAVGVAREQARKDLPLSTYTEAYWKIDLHNLLHFLQLRMDSHAQNEIRQYANLIGEQIVARWCPITWKAFCDYRLDAMSLTRSEVAILKSIQESRERATEVAVREGLLDSQGKPRKNSRELQELEGKLHMLGYEIPWSNG